MGVVIADDGSCDELYNSCGARFGGLAEGGFGARDLPSSWDDVYIPTVLVTHSIAARLKHHMNLVAIHHPVYGHQMIDRSSLEDEDHDDRHHEL